MLRLAFSVVADWRVIVTAVLTVFIISLANYVIRYKKRPLSLKKRKALLKAQAEAAAAAAKTERRKTGRARLTVTTTKSQLQLLPGQRKNSLN